MSVVGANPIQVEVFSRKPATILRRKANRLILSEKTLGSVNVELLIVREQGVQLSQNPKPPLEED